MGCIFAPGGCRRPCGSLKVTRDPAWVGRTDPHLSQPSLHPSPTGPRCPGSQPPAFTPAPQRTSIQAQLLRAGSIAVTTTPLSLTQTLVPAPLTQLSWGWGGRTRFIVAFLPPPPQPHTPHSEHRHGQEAALGPER